MNKQRGKFLTVLLVLNVIGLVLGGLFMFNTAALKAAFGSVPVWYLPYSVLSLVLGAATVVGLWKMKKWGVYLLAGSTVLSLLVTFILSKGNLQGLGMSVVSMLLVGGLWFWAIKRKWSSFD